MNVEIFQKSLVLKHTWSLARGSVDRKEYSYLRIEHDGIVGWGEAAHNEHYGASLDSVRAVLGLAQERLERDPESVRTWADWVPDLLHAEAAALAAVDIACRDWVSRAEGRRFFETGPGGGFVTSLSIGIDEPEKIREKVREAQAFHVLKIKLGTPQDRAIVEAVRDASDVPIRVDANEGWEDRDEAARTIEWLAERNVELVEQPLPVDRFDDVAWLRERTALPVVADEDVHGIDDVERLAQVYDGINVKLMKAGGATPAAAMLSRARKFGLKTMAGCMVESSIGITAAAFLAPGIDWLDLDGNLLIKNDPFRGVECREGRLYLPDGIGLCVEENG